jgi:hypothetical protein
MSNLLIWIGRIAGLAGAALLACAVLTRAMGLWHLGSMQVGTLLSAGVAAMVLGGLAYAAAIAERGPG